MLDPGESASAPFPKARCAQIAPGPHAVPLLGFRADHDEPRYSTPELLALESRILDAAVRLRASGRGVVASAVVDAAIECRPFLAEEQRVMVRRLTGEGDGVSVVIGLAGTGKTTALAAAREAWERSDVPVRGCALARKAAQELEQEAGLRHSVAGLLHRPRALPEGAVLIVDEAGMLGTRDLGRLLTLVEAARGKLVLAGDASQLPSIEAGGALQALSRRLDPIELRENRRQRHDWEREAVEALRLGDERALVDQERHPARQLPATGRPPSMRSSSTSRRRPAAHRSSTATPSPRMRPRA